MYEYLQLINDRVKNLAKEIGIINQRRKIEHEYIKGRFDILGEYLLNRGTSEIKESEPETSTNKAMIAIALMDKLSSNFFEIKHESNRRLFVETVVNEWRSAKAS